MWSRIKVVNQKALTCQVQIRQRQYLNHSDNDKINYKAINSHHLSDTIHLIEHVSSQFQVPVATERYFSKYVVTLTMACWVIENGKTKSGQKYEKKLDCVKNID